MAASPDPLREPLCSVSLGNCDITSGWTPLTLGACGAQVEGAANGAPRERERLRLEAELGRLRSAPPSIGTGIGMY